MLFATKHRSVLQNFTLASLEVKNSRRAPLTRLKSRDLFVQVACQFTHNLLYTQITHALVG